MATLKLDGGRWDRGGEADMRLALIVVAVLALAGCGAGSGSDGAKAPAHTTTKVATGAAETTTTPAPATTTTVAIDYGQQYLALVTPANCALDTLKGAEKAHENDDDAAYLAALQPLTEQVSTAYVTFLEGLVAAAWPPDLQPSIDVLTGELSTQATLFHRLATAENPEQYTSTYEDLAEEATKANTAAIVRAKLKLPTNIGDETTCPAPA